MMFLNGIALSGLAIIAVPILVHLRKRKKAKVVDWAAMQFLSQSIANRRQGVALEHLLLLVCRCLLVAFFVLAMARPKISSLADLQWIGALVFGFAGLVLLVHAIVHQKRQRWTSLAFSIAFLVFATVIALLGSRPKPNGLGSPRDVAIVIDSSSSMKVQVEDKSNFQRAIDEARELIDQLPTGSTVSILEAGPIIKKQTTTPLTNLRRAANLVQEQVNIGGATNILDAVKRSKRILEKGLHPTKQIVLFTDNQLRPWEMAGDAHVSDLPKESASDSMEDADSTGSDSAPAVEVFGRSFKLPSRLDDIAITGLKVQDGILVVNRPIQVDVELFNSGTSAQLEIEIEFLVDGERVGKRLVGQLEAHSKRTEAFQHSFASPGFHTMEARLTGEDELDDDNVVFRAVHVRSELPILLVNGDVSSPPMEKSATFAQLALDPSSLHRGTEVDSNRFVHVDRVDAADIINLENSLTNYQLVILCDVPRLPKAAAHEIATFVEAGGGLWVIPGKRCESEFYNSWKAPSQNRTVLPARLIRRNSLAKNAKPLSIDVDSVGKPVFKRLIESGEHDLSELEVITHWVLNEQSSVRSPAQVGIRLTNGSPFVVEHSIGQGKVMLMAISLDHLESNFVQRLSFPVLMHLWARSLAIGQELDLNYDPAAELMIGLPFPMVIENRDQLTFRQPNDLVQDVRTSETDSRIQANLGEVSTPGIYWISANPLAGKDQSNRVDIPFTVSNNPNEFDFATASELKLSEFGQRFGIKWLKNVDELKAIATGTTSGYELWKWLVCAALLTIVLESLIVRWVSSRRAVPSSQSNVRSESVLPASFSPPPLPVPLASIPGFVPAAGVSEDGGSRQDEVYVIETGADR